MADLEVIFGLDDIDKIDCIFDINATVYDYPSLANLPQINGETLIGNKTSEELHLASSQSIVDVNNRIDTIVESFDGDIERLEQNIQNEATTRAENDTLLQNNINTLDEKVDGINVNLTAQIDNLEQDVNTKYNELVNDIDEEIQAREQADTTINQRITDVADELNSKADKSEIPTKTSELENDSTFTTEQEVAQMIAQIPQFEVKIVQELPQTGEAMVLYLVPKDGEAPDVYLEYIWIATTQTFELIGSTTVDLTDYVKNTDYATTTVAGVIKQNANYSTSVNTNGYLTALVRTLQQYSTLSDSAFISKGTLENIKENLVTSIGDNKYQPTGDYATNTALTNGLATKQDVITDLGDIRNNIATNTSNISYLDEKVRDIELFKFPNAVIIGEPTISNGQVSGFSTMSYLQFPFILDLHNQAFQIDFSFTTATNVQTQQNILDSNFGLALAIANGKGLMAISSNGTSWDIGSAIGSINIQSNTTYYARLSWNRLQYKTQLSTDGVNYTDDMVIVDTRSPYPRTIFIGGCDQLETGHAPHPFLGTINMNKATLSVMGNVIWQGMDDVGLATRADISLSNLDELGQAKFDEKVGFTDYATSAKGGIFRPSSAYATSVSSNGYLTAQTISDYASISNSAFISKGTLEKIKEDLVTSVGDTKYQPVGDYATNTALNDGLAGKTRVIIRSW